MLPNYLSAVLALELVLLFPFPLWLRFLVAYIRCGSDKLGATYYNSAKIFSFMPLVN